jgi:hypothetical protein
MLTKQMGQTLYVAEHGTGKQRKGRIVRGMQVTQGSVLESGVEVRRKGHVKSASPYPDAGLT